MICKGSAIVVLAFSGAVALALSVIVLGWGLTHFRKPEVEKAWVTTCGISQTLNDYGNVAPYRLSCITKWQNVPNEE